MGFWVKNYGVTKNVDFLENGPGANVLEENMVRYDVYLQHVKVWERLAFGKRSYVDFKFENENQNLKTPKIRIDQYKASKAGALTDEEHQWPDKMK